MDGASPTEPSVPPEIFRAQPKASVVPAFVTPSWTQAPHWDANHDFFRLVPGGPPHIDADEYGFTSLAVYPDFAVVDDIEGGRPPERRGAAHGSRRGPDRGGVLEWRGARERHTGIVFYRVTLVGTGGTREARTGRAVVLP